MFCCLSLWVMADTRLTGERQAVVSRRLLCRRARVAQEGVGVQDAGSEWCSSPGAAADLSGWARSRWIFAPSSTQDWGACREQACGCSSLHHTFFAPERSCNRTGQRVLEWGGSSAPGLRCLRLPRVESADGLENKFDFKSRGFKEELLIEVTFLKSWSKYCPLLSTEILLSGCCDPNKLCSRDGRAQCELFYFVVQMHPVLSVWGRQFSKCK